MKELPPLHRTRACEREAAGCSAKSSLKCLTRKDKTGMLLRFSSAGVLRAPAGEPSGPDASCIPRHGALGRAIRCTNELHRGLIRQERT
ncbi:hypothetical protein C7S16_1545 [Burkholderia thailandensis]|uniref:Uncharacterized protein n=1 Tax=Burkholderia thailandensis TaxID=57975 RepID=A0AAW9CZK5_BURTH|nr:hypothetical protein [Burkholderia thailandensis]MDW9256034.1 hypothetical protein [Burkholderia thailandensis]